MAERMPYTIYQLGRMHLDFVQTTTSFNHFTASHFISLPEGIYMIKWKTWWMCKCFLKSRKCSWCNQKVFNFILLFTFSVCLFVCSFVASSSHGVSGKDCLLKMFCQATRMDFSGGIFYKAFQILFGWVIVVVPIGTKCVLVTAFIAGQYIFSKL